MLSVSELPAIEQEVVYALLTLANRDRVARLRARELASFLREDAGAVEFALFSLIRKRYVQRLDSGCWRIADQVQRPRLRAAALGAQGPSVTSDALAQILEEAEKSDCDGQSHPLARPGH